MSQISWWKTLAYFKWIGLNDSTIDNRIMMNQNAFFIHYFFFFFFVSALFPFLFFMALCVFGVEPQHNHEICSLLLGFIHSLATKCRLPVEKVAQESSSWRLKKKHS